jgi:hypothetical protein
MIDTAMLVLPQMRAADYPETGYQPNADGGSLARMLARAAQRR